MFKDFFINVELTSDNAKMPERAHSSDAGLDFFSPCDFVISPRSDYLLPLDVKVEFPNGYALVFCEKSGVATKKKIDILAKIIDSSYRGVVHAHLYNNSDYAVTFSKGDKVVQGLIVPCWTGLPSKVDYVSNDTSRGVKGFGSSDVKECQGNCVDGERILEVYDSDNHLKHLTYKDLCSRYNSGDSQYFVDAFDCDFDIMVKIRIKRMFVRKYHGKVFSVLLDNGKTFECTHDHHLPIKSESGLVGLKIIADFKENDFVMTFNGDEISYRRICKITSEDVHNYYVYNLELEQFPKKDFLFYVDFGSELIIR